MTKPPHLSWVLAKSSGLSESEALSVLRVRQDTDRMRVPALYSLRHLAASADVGYGLLRSVVARQGRPYREIHVPKRAGGIRVLHAPVEDLMRAQRWVLHEVLDHLPRNESSYAYFPGVTPVECAARHVGGRWMIKADIHNYFPSLGERGVFEVFASLGYPRLLAFELARICTWPTARSVMSTRKLGGEPYSVRTPAGALPQGAPTSGALANAMTYSLDDALNAFATREGFVYTRYSDDIALSAASTFDRGRASDLVTQVRKIVTSSGLQLHEKKLKLISPGSRKIVLGLLVLEDRVRITPERRRRIDLYLHGVEKYGVLSFAERRGFESVLTFINHVDGWLAYTSHVEPEWTAQRMMTWTAALREHGVDRAALGL